MRSVRLVVVFSGLREFLNDDQHISSQHYQRKHELTFLEVSELVFTKFDFPGHFPPIDGGRLNFSFSSSANPLFKYTVRYWGRCVALELESDPGGVRFRLFKADGGTLDMSEYASFGIELTGTVLVRVDVENIEVMIDQVFGRRSNNARFELEARR